MHDIYYLMGKYMYLNEKVLYSCFHICLKIKYQILQTNISTTKIQKVFFYSSWVVFILTQVYKRKFGQNKHFVTENLCVKLAGV